MSAVPSTLCAGEDVTYLLQRWSFGHSAAADDLAAAVYGELHKIASSYLRSERHSHTLQPTALIAEAWLRLRDRQSEQWASRADFFRFAAHVMRHVLVDHARTRSASKRGGGAAHDSLFEGSASVNARPAALLDLDAALNRLADLDSRKAAAIELRYFGGMTVEEAACALNVSVATTARELRLAVAWLRRELGARA